MWNSSVPVVCCLSAQAHFWHCSVYQRANKNTHNHTTHLHKPPIRSMAVTQSGKNFGIWMQIQFTTNILWFLRWLTYVPPFYRMLWCVRLRAVELVCKFNWSMCSLFRICLSWQIVFFFHRHLYPSASYLWSRKTQYCVLKCWYDVGLSQSTYLKWMSWSVTSLPSCSRRDQHVVSFLWSFSYFRLLTRPKYGLVCWVW